MFLRQSKESKLIFPFDMKNESEVRFVSWARESSFKGRESKIWSIWRGIPEDLEKFKVKPSNFDNIVSEKVRSCKVRNGGRVGSEVLFFKMVGNGENV